MQSMSWGWRLLLAIYGCHTMGKKKKTRRKIISLKIKNKKLREAGRASGGEGVNG